MKPDELREFLNQQQIDFEETEVPYGRKFACEGGEIFVAYDTSKVVCQGKATELTKSVKEWKKPSKAEIHTKEHVAAGPNNRIFIVYGHDIAAREGLELMLHKMGLEPIVLANLPAAGDTIIEN